MDAPKHAFVMVIVRSDGTWVPEAFPAKWHSISTETASKARRIPSEDVKKSNLPATVQ
jgi:hypothetical protein